MEPTTGWRGGGGGGEDGSERKNAESGGGGVRGNKRRAKDRGGCSWKGGWYIKEEVVELLTFYNQSSCERGVEDALASQLRNSVHSFMGSPTGTPAKAAEELHSEYISPNPKVPQPHPSSSFGRSVVAVAPNTDLTTDVLQPES